MVLAIHSR